MQYTVILSPELRLTPQEFAGAWEGDPACQQAAQAEAAQAKGAAFDPALAGAALTVLGGVAVGLATNALYDLIKSAVQRALAQKGRPPQQIEIVSLTQPDGTHLLVVKILK
jgi:hypothetical protein